jgi:hypothetical protein
MWLPKINSFDLFSPFSEYFWKIYDKHLFSIQKYVESEYENNSVRKKKTG